MSKKLQTAERCSQNDMSDNVVYQRFLFAYEQAAATVFGKVAEAGCGESYGIRLVLPKVDFYVAMDKYPTHIAHEQTEKLFFKQMNFPNFGGIPTNFFDFVICFQVVEHIREDNLFIERIAALLKKGGKLLLTTPQASMSLTRNPFHVREYEYSQLETLMKPHFKDVAIKGIFGKQAVMEYYEANKASVAHFRKFDVFDLEHHLPASLLKIPYNYLNRRNRRKLLKQNNQTLTMNTGEFYLDSFASAALDFFVIAEK